MGTGFHTVCGRLKVLSFLLVTYTVYINDTHHHLSGDMLVMIIMPSYDTMPPFQVTCPKLYEQIKNTLARTLKQTALIIEFVTSLGKEVKWHGRQESESAHYCNNCEVSRWLLSLLPHTTG